MQNLALLHRINVALLEFPKQLAPNGLAANLPTVISFVAQEELVPMRSSGTQQ